MTGGALVLPGGWGWGGAPPSQSWGRVSGIASAATRTTPLPSRSRSMIRRHLAGTRQRADLSAARDCRSSTSATTRLILPRAYGNVLGVLMRAAAPERRNRYRTAPKFRRAFRRAAKVELGEWSP